MAIVRRALTAGLLVLGLYYAAVGAVTLVNVSDVTARWIELSNDADFRLDGGVFSLYIGLGSFAVTGLGFATVLVATKDLRGVVRGSPSWAGLFIAALLIHVLAFFYKVIEGGTLPPDELHRHMLTTSGRFALTCAPYGVAWWLSLGQPSISAPQRGPAGYC